MVAKCWKCKKTYKTKETNVILDLARGNVTKLYRVSLDNFCRPCRKMAELEMKTTGHLQGKKLITRSG